ncbi:type II secretion system F family protein [Nitrospirillum iridis]|uniref:General secretion pathway protein F n=1 Tax=Nitrospirillum iridis TaxID=765888 RepID=A0A7X0EFT2_9PROT|nr:type II secretion system F family protein [Nitrospirillum iridis]MBB6253381.1 general secretion pathway protein F [Nitrospirillum iridis]
MVRYVFKAVSAEGRRSQGGLDAVDDAGAVDQLLQRGLTPLTLKAEATGRRWRRSADLTRGERLSFIRDLANLAAAGFALEPALGLVGDQMPRAAAMELVAGLRQRVRAGETLGRAMAAYSTVFPPEFLGLVTAGEQGGSLAEALGHLSALEEARSHFRQRLVSAMIYPALIALLTLAALGVMAGYVLPQFQDLFAGSKAKLPTATLAVLAVGDFLGRYGPLFLAAATGGILIFLRALKYREVRARVDRLVLSLGPLGRLVRDAQLALYTRTLASLLSGGVPLAPALATASACLGNHALAAASDRVRLRVRGGESLSHATGAEPLFPRRLVRLLAMAEQTASLPRALLDLSQVLERERGMALDRALSLLTPVLTLILGGMVGAIFAALISGIMSLNDIAI